MPRSITPRGNDASAPHAVTRDLDSRASLRRARSANEAETKQIDALTTCATGKFQECEKRVQAGKHAAAQISHAASQPAHSPPNKPPPPPPPLSPTPGASTHIQGTWMPFQMRSASTKQSASVQHKGTAGGGVTGLMRSLSDGQAPKGGAAVGAGTKEKERDGLRGIDRKLASTILDEIVDHTVNT